MIQEPITLTPFVQGDLAPVVSLLARCLPLEGITVESFTRRVALDPNFDPQGAIVARSSGAEVLGFMLAIRRRQPLEDAPDDRDRGWITLFAVAPEFRGQGIGGRLLAAAETFLIGHGCASVLISPYSPGYWTPGIDEAAHPDALAWLLRRDFDMVTRPMSMELRFGEHWRVPEPIEATCARLRREGVKIAAFTPREALPLLDFLAATFPGDWQRSARETMHAILSGYRPAEALWTAMRGETCVGFAQGDGERFGPIGVADSERGRGIGAVLMYRTVEAMRRQGRNRAYFLWTNDDTADRLYRPAGFREIRRFALLMKPLLPVIGSAYCLF